MFGTVAADRLDDFFVYAIHLKSGASSSDKTVRANKMQIIRDDADNLGINANIIYAGDFNLHGSSEGAWINMTAPGDGRVFDDGANAPGEWRDNSAFKILHTQDPRGNMDGRFDFQFVSGELLDDVGQIGQSPIFEAMCGLTSIASCHFVWRGAHEYCAGKVRPCM